MSTKLPIVHKTCYQSFQQRLEQLRTQIGAIPADLTTLKAEVERVQSWFQSQILSLNPDELEPAIAHHVQSYQVEMHKQLRLLATDLNFLQAARKPATVEQRRAQVRDRVETLIRYCEAVMGG